MGERVGRAGGLAWAGWQEPGASMAPPDSFRPRSSPCWKSKNEGEKKNLKHKEPKAAGMHTWKPCVSNIIWRPDVGAANSRSTDKWSPIVPHVAVSSSGLGKWWTIKRSDRTETSRNKHVHWLPAEPRTCRWAGVPQEARPSWNSMSS